MLTHTLRTGSELSSGEKTDIFQRMFAVQNPGERDSARESLAIQYGISEGTINSLVAHETMRRSRATEGPHIDSQEGGMVLSQDTRLVSGENPTQTVQAVTQAGVYVITTLSGITEEMRHEILDEFTTIIQDSSSDQNYDFYQDIEAISEYHNIDPNILEQFLKNAYKWLGETLDNLKKGRVLTEEEKRMIRLYVSEGIDEKDKKTRRKEMAIEYGVSTYVIGAVTAWKLDESGGVVLKKDYVNTNPVGETSGNEERVLEIPDQIQSKDNLLKQDGYTIPKVASTDQIVSLQVGQTKNHQIVEVLSEAEGGGNFVFSEEDRFFIQELAQEFDLNDDEQRKNFLDDVFDLFPDLAIDDVKRSIPDFPDDRSHTNPKRSGEGMGALINYNNEIKNKWRQKLKEFIDENTDKNKRENMRILCLPGVECLEIPLYIELGFRPENIVGVEAGIVKGKKDPEVVERFQANAAKYGIQTRIGKLENILETEDTVFDVLSLDFLGPISLPSRLIAQRVNLNDKAVICTNYLNRREGDFGKKSLFAGNLPKAINLNPSYNDILSEVDVNKDREINVPSGEERSDSHHVAILKQFTLDSGRVPSELNLQLAKFRKIDPAIILYKNREVETSNFFDGNEYNFTRILDIRQKINEAISTAFLHIGLHDTGDEKQREFVNFQIWANLSKINALIQDLILSEFIIDGSTKSSYKYIGNTNSPMYSDFFVIRKLSQKEKAPFKKCLNFLTRMAECILSTPEVVTKISIRRKNKNLPIFDLENEVVLKNTYGIEIASIKLRNIENARFEWRKIYGDSYNPPIRQRIQ